MKNIFALLTVLSVAFYAEAVQAQNLDKVVYGTDGRMEVFQAPSHLAELAKATAVQIPNYNIKETADGYLISGKSFKDSARLCEGELFSTQLTPGVCSGFLVAPDLFVTAGHCVKTQAECLTYSWVFDYDVNTDGSVKTTVPKNTVYKCASLVAQELNRTTKNDFAVIKLDRIVENRTPFTFRTNDKVADNADLVVIGNPSGLPTKVTIGGTMRKNDNQIFFEANLDTFSGNSGSAVLDANSGMIEGILVRGESDFMYNSVKGCYQVRVCAEGTCRGEDVTRITNLTKFISR